MVSQHTTLRLENAESFEEEKTDDIETGLTVNAEVSEMEEGDNPAGVQQVVVDNVQCEANPLHDNVDNKQSKSKWHRKIRLRNKKVQQNETSSTNQFNLTEVSQNDKTEEPHRQNSVTFANDASKDPWYQKLKMHKKNKNMSENNLVVLEELNQEEDNGHGNHNLKTMEALGIYGLLTPAIAAVPATDEVSMIHRNGVIAKRGHKEGLLTKGKEFLTRSRGQNKGLQ